MKECNLLQTYEIFLKLIYFKLLQEYWTYEYDALNHRISRSCGEETTKYAYGRNGALAYQEKTVDGSAFISEAPARDGANWYGYAGCNPMVYMDRIGLFYYTAEGQQSSNNNKQTDTVKSETPSGMPQNQSPNKTGGGSSGEPEGVSPMVQAPKDTYAFQESDKSENSAKKSLLDEFFDIFDLCSVGIRDEFSINVPNIFSLSMGINLVSTNTEKGNNNYMDSSLFFSFSLGTENVSIYEFETGIVKKVPNAATPFELFGVSAEPYVKEDINKDFIVTLPIPFVSIELNISEGVDFLEKLYKTLLQKLNNKE